MASGTAARTIRPGTGAVPRSASWCRRAVGRSGGPLEGLAGFTRMFRGSAARPGSVTLRGECCGHVDAWPGGGGLAGGGLARRLGCAAPWPALALCVAERAVLPLELGDLVHGPRARGRRSRDEAAAPGGSVTDHHRRVIWYMVHERAAGVARRGGSAGRLCNRSPSPCCGTLPKPGAASGPAAPPALGHVGQADLRLPGGRRMRSGQLPHPVQERLALVRRHQDHVTARGHHVEQLGDG